MAEEISDELLNIIANGEKITTEFKEAKNKLPKNLFETVCAYLNRNGGNIFLGVKDNKEIIGVDEDAVPAMKKDFANLCNNPQKIDPTVYLSIHDYKINGKIILHIYVHESSNVHRTGNKVFDRNEDGDYEVRQAERIANIYLRKQEFYTENRIYPYAEMSDLRSDLIQRARQMANINDKNHVWANMSDEEILKSTNLYAKDISTGKSGLTLAAILLFGKDETILSALPHHKTDAIYRVKNLDRYDDRDDIRTNLIESYDRLMSFIEKHLDDRFYLEDDQRIDVRKKIGREVCTNLLIHREFANPYPAKLIIEKDVLRTENANKAKMIGKINVHSYEPYPKNPKIAKVFKEMGLVDELGSGVRNLYKYTKIYSGGTPELNENDIFRTTIPISENSINSYNENSENNENSTLEEKVLKLFENYEYLTNGIIEQELSIKSKKIYRILKSLIEDEKIKKIGKNKGTKYYLIK